MELQLLDHETSDNLFLVLHLVVCLLGEQLWLPDEKRDEADSMMTELIVHISESFVRIQRELLRFIAK